MYILRQHYMSTQVVSVAVTSEGYEVPESISKLRHGHLRHDCITLNTITLWIFVSVSEANS